VNIEYPPKINLKSVNLIDAQGKTIKSFPNPGNTFDVSGLPSGHYLLKIETGAGVIDKKLVIH
jgi:hypothetical protein